MHIFKLDLTLSPSEGCQTIGGRQLHALLFNIIKAADQDEAEWIHELSDKPFSLWWQQQQEKVEIEMPVFSERLAQILLKALPARDCFLGRSQAEVTVKSQTPISEDVIWQEAAKAADSDRLKLSFLTPTSFRRSGVQLLFPEPELLFRNTYAKMERYGGEYTKNNIIHPDEFSRCIAVARYKLETTEVNYGKYKVIGCTGYAVYNLSGLKVWYMRQGLAFLALLSNYTGIGYKTTMGMGKVKAGFGTAADK